MNIENLVLKWKIGDKSIIWVQVKMRSIKCVINSFVACNGFVTIIAISLSTGTFTIHMMSLRYFKTFVLISEII